MRSLPLPTTSCVPARHVSSSNSIITPTIWPAQHPWHRRQRHSHQRAASQPPPPGGDTDARTRRALREVAELLAEAQELAQQQALDELRSSWAADGGSSSDASSGLQQPQQQQRSSAAALQAFLVEQGLTQAAATRLLAALLADERLKSSCLSTAALAAKLQALARVLPGADVAALVAAEPQLLGATSGVMVNNLVTLVNGLQGHDVISMVVRRPSLLLVQDMPDRLRRITTKLLQLHPSHEPSVIAGILAENPELLFRMDYWLSDDVRLIDELPIEIQNMMVLGDESGVGFLYRYWKERRAQEARQPQSSSSSSRTVDDERS